MSEQLPPYKLEPERVPVKRKWTVEDRAVFGLTLVGGAGLGEVLNVIAHGGWGGAAFAAAAAAIIAKSSPDIYAGMKDYLPWMDLQNSVTQMFNEKEAGSRSLADRLMGRSYVAEASASPARATMPDAVPMPQTANPYLLHLAPDYTPHIQEILGRGILGVGQRGTGKSNLAARLIEQMGRFPIPMAIFDYKQDYLTLPDVLERCVIAGAPGWEGQGTCRYYWEVTPANAEQVGHAIFERGVQMVFQCLSYETLDEAAEIMTGIIKGMFTWASKQPAGKRVPSLILLDEAQQFLPQQQGDSRVSPEIAKKLFLAFEKLNSVGRSLGLTPAFFTQRIAQLRKEVIGGAEIFFLLAQSLVQDLEVYEKLIGRDERGRPRIQRHTIQGFGPGDGLVFENGVFFQTHFYQRESEHLSITPGIDDAIDFYAGRPVHLDFNERPTGTPARLQPAQPKEEKQPTLTLELLMQLLQEDKIDLDTFKRLLDSIEISESDVSRPVPSRSSDEAFTSSESPNLRIVGTGDGTSPGAESYPHNELEKPVPAFSRRVPDLGPDDRAFTAEQDQDFLRRYEKVRDIKACLGQMVNNRGGIGLSNRYYRYAKWLVEQQKTQYAQGED